MDLQHVFVLMLENRSFDHMLGWSRLSGADAHTGDPTAADGLSGDEWNELAGGSRVPVSAGADYVLGVDPNHEFADVLAQLCGPGAVYPAPGGGYPPITSGGFAARLEEMARRTGATMDPSIVMRGFRPDQLPVLNTLAREFALCDHWFSSTPGPTWPNRFFVHAATSGGLDGSPSPLRSAEAVLAGYHFANGTIYDRLDEAHIPWSVVEGDALPQALGIAGMIERALEGRFVSLEELRERLAQPAFEDRYVFIEPHYGHVLADGRNFKCGNSQHPLDDVTRGERLLKGVYEAIRQSPHWSSSALFVLYDEHGGFYDHVAPPTATPPGDRFIDGVNRNGFGFERLGVRVPAVVVSPLTPRGVIDHGTYDHSALLATLEYLWDLEPLTARDGGSDRLDHLFGLATGRDDAPMVLPDPAPSEVPDCEDSLTHRLAGDLDKVPGEVGEMLSGLLEPALVGFIEVAMARELHLAAITTRDVEVALARERDRLSQQYHELKTGTKHDATRFLRSVETRYREARSRGA